MRPGQWTSFRGILAGPLLYSTNPFLKHYIQTKYRGDRHWVWCSEQFDTTKLAAYGAAAGNAPSSDPCDLYKRFSADVTRADAHSSLIESQRQAMLKHATRWHKAGEIDSATKAEIAYQARNSPVPLWRPLIYVIPRALVESRLVPVPAPKRAGLGGEWMLEETLLGHEFDPIELG